MRISLITAALIALPVFAACGNDKNAAATTVTQADIAKSLQTKGLKNPALADCAAKIFVEQGISQEGLRTMISDKYDNQPVDPETLGMNTDDADKARTATSKIATECVAPR